MSGGNGVGIGDSSRQAMTPWRRGASLLLAALLVFSGVMKLRDPLSFAFAIKAFKLGLGEETIAKAAYVIPWLEIIASTLLLFGGHVSRAAALVIALLMATFIAAIASLLLRDLDVTCPCFGGLDVLCRGPLGICHIVRNTVLMATAAWLARRRP